MLKNKYLFFLLSISLSITLFIFVSINNVFASPAIISLLFNGSSQNITFNPNSDETVSIEVKANTPVKFTRLYICSIDQICNGTSGNYTRYFTQSDISDTITKIWNGKKSGDIEIAPAGEYKIMVSMTEGIDSPVLEFGQHSIFVNFTGENSTTTDSNDTVSTSTNEDPPAVPPPSVSVTTRVVYVSTHSSPEELSDYNGKSGFEISAGRERTALVGSPIEFNAKYTLPQKDQCVPNFKWSFGDGFEIMGKNIDHTYKYSGEYLVVLNGTCGEYSSISRTLIKVISPNILILELTNGDIEIINNGKIEINIGNWKIKGYQKDFIFPEDTIISSGRKIILSKEDLSTGTFSKRISLNNPSGREVAYFIIKNVEKEDEEFSLPLGDRQDSVLIDNFISIEEAEKLAIAYKSSLSIKNKEIGENKNTKESNIANESSDDLLDNDIIQTATVLDAANSVTIKGFWSKLINVPIDSIKSLANMFYDF